mgnify:CR=1 FL=1
MARSRYEYGTNPRKLEPNYEPQKRTKNRNLKLVEDLPRQDVKISKMQKKKQLKLTMLVLFIFAILLTISYRNSKISEKFSEIQNQKKQLATIQKENEQLKVVIENGETLNNVEKIAKEKLGMQKLTNKQTVYVNLPKEDYVESASEEVVVQEEKNWFEQILDKIFK